MEIFVRPARAADGDRAVWQVSAEGGVAPAWSPRGDELLYRDRDRRIIAVPFSAAGDAFVAGKPRFWLEKAGAPPPDGPFDISADGKRLLFLVDPEGLRKTTPPSDIVMLLNFFDELKRRVPLR